MQESDDDKSVDTIIAADVSELDRKKIEAEIKATQLAKYETDMQQKMAEFEKKIMAIQRDTEHESEMKRTQICKSFPVVFINFYNELNLNLQSN